MRTELERRPLVLALAGLVVGLSAPVYLANLLFIAFGLIWLRGAAPRIALSLAFCVGAMLAPLFPQILTKPIAVDGVYTVTSSPTLRPEGGSAFLAEAGGVQWEVISPRLVPVLGDEVAVQGEARPLPQERERTYLARGVSGVVSGPSSTVGVIRHSVGLAAWGAAWRDSFLEYTGRRLPPADGAVANALAFDVRTGLSPEVRTELEQSGTVHVLAASGLHLLALAWFLELVGRRLPIHLLIRQIIQISLISIYSAAAGFHPGTFRALVATVLRDGAPVIGREYDALTGLATAGVLYLLWRPNMVYDAGFQLSMILGFGIALFGARSAGMSPLPRLFKCSLVAWMVSIPVVAHLFGIVSVVSIPANLLAILLLPVCLLGLLASHAVSFVSSTLGDIFLLPATLSAHGLELVVRGFGTCRVWGFMVPAFSGYWLTFIYGAALAMWRPKARPVT